MGLRWGQITEETEIGMWALGSRRCALPEAAHPAPPQRTIFLLSRNPDGTRRERRRSGWQLRLGPRIGFFRPHRGNHHLDAQTRGGVPVAKYDGPSIRTAQDPASPSPVDAIIAGRRSRKTTRSTSQRHGLTLRGLGSRVVDRRTTLGKALPEWRQELTQDLGGPDAVSTQQRAIVDLAVRTKFLLDSIDPSS
jgi:hypothetical protein